MASRPDTVNLENAVVLVTGGHGFIGRHVVATLSRLGANPISVIHPSGGPVRGIPGEILTVDLEDLQGVTEIVENMDFVVHLAARTGGIQFQRKKEWEAFTANRRMTDNVLIACEGSKVRRLFIASSLVVYREAAEPLTEDHPLLDPGDRPDPYSWSKVSDEVVASWHDRVGTVIGRFGNIYGPGGSFDSDRSTVVHALIDRAARLPDGAELMVWGDGSARRSFTFVQDAAEGVVVALAGGQAGMAYNIDSGMEVTIEELGAEIRDQVNPSLRLRFDRSKPAGAPYRVGSISKLAALGYAPAVSLREGVRRTVEWYRDEMVPGHT